MSTRNLATEADLLKIIAVLVDAMRRSDPEYVLAHGLKQCTDDDWDTAIRVGEDALEANQCADYSARLAIALGLLAKHGIHLEERWCWCKPTVEDHREQIR